MSLNFKPGDLMLFFSRKAVYLAILDDVDENYFTIITSEDDDYHYGFKIKIKNLNSKNFVKLDQGFPQTIGIWKFYEHDYLVMDNMLLGFKDHIRNTA